MIVALAAMVTALALASLAVSVYTLLNAHKLVYDAKMAIKNVHADCAAAIDAAKSQIDAIAMELETHNKSQTLTETIQGVPKPGMNLTRRANALRLHRKGTPAEQIAGALDVPRQEVELLLKVHEIVLNNL